MGELGSALDEGTLERLKALAARLPEVKGDDSDVEQAADVDDVEELDQDVLDDLAEHADDPEAKYDTSPVGTPGGRENWVDKAGGLPPFIRAVAHALIREGRPKSQAIAIAVGRIKAWARGGGNVTAKTRAKAVATIAAWERMKAKADDVNPETKGASVGDDGVWDFDAIGMGLVAGEANTPTGDAAEYKEVGAQVIDVDRKRGIVTAIVSVTGIEDRVKDVIHPGAYKKTLAERKPKGVWSHDWDKPISKTLEAVELLPGDSRLPKTMRGPGGKPVAWPAEAGGLLVKTQFNLLGERGKQALADVEFFADDQEWSIGYNVPPGAARIEAKSGVRHIFDVDLFEYSPVLFGAMPAAATVSGGWDVKSAQTAVKAAHMMLDAETVARARALRGVEVKRQMDEHAAGTPNGTKPKPAPPASAPASGTSGGSGGSGKRKFDESKISRDEEGQFSAKKGSGYKRGDDGKEKDSAKVDSERAEVRQLQKMLVEMGLLSKDSGAGGGVDGLFGPKTEAALKEYQRRNDLPESGELDAETKAKLFGKPKAAEGDKPAADKPAAEEKPKDAPAVERGERETKPAEGDKPAEKPAPKDDAKPAGTVTAEQAKKNVPSGSYKYEDDTPMESPSGASGLAFENGSMVYEDGSVATADGKWDKVSDAEVDALWEDRNKSREANGLPPKPKPGKKSDATDMETNDVDEPDEVKGAFPGAAAPFGSKDKDKGKDGGKESDDDGDDDPKKPHKFVKGSDGKCKTCGKDFSGHMKSQRQSATGDTKADAPRECPNCESTELNEFADGSIECDSCGYVLREAKTDDADLETLDLGDVEVKAGRVLSTANLTKAKAAYEALGELLRAAGALDSPAAPAEEKADEPVVETKTIEPPVARIGELDLLRARRLELLAD